MDRPKKDIKYYCGPTVSFLAVVVWCRLLSLHHIRNLTLSEKYQHNGIELVYFFS